MSALFILPLQVNNVWGEMTIIIKLILIKNNIQNVAPYCIVAT